MKFRRLRANEIDARVAFISEKGCSLLLYKDARVDQNILDETVGAENWQRSHQIIGNNLYCTVSIWDSEKGLWISKQDVGTESYTEKEKGQASDSFKRACFNWGIGRELYTAPFIWINGGNVKVEDRNGKKTTHDTFTVKDIGYNNSGEIIHLKIQNDKQKKIVYTYGQEQEFPQELEPITAQEQEVLKALCERKGLDPVASFSKGLNKLTAKQYAEAVAKLGKLKDAT